MTDRERRPWWVIGCVGLLGLLLCAVVVVAALTWLSIRGRDLRSPVLVQQRAPADPVPLADATPGLRAPLRILLELDSCELYLEPAAAGEPLRVEAHYDARDYRLEEIVDEAGPGNYRLRFLVISSRLIAGIKEGLRGGQPQLRIGLPLDTPIDLTLVQRNGGAIVDLGGLNLTSVDFDVGGALLKVDADERLQGELERFRVYGRQGGLVVESLDLMEPRQVEVDFSMGQALLDFRGTWVADGRVDLATSLTDLVVRLPRGARVTGLEGNRVVPPSDAETPGPTLTFAVTTGRRTTVRVFD